MNNPIPRCGLFATPESIEDLMAYVNRMSGSERVVASTVAMMALNLANKLVEKELTITVD